MLFVLSPLHYCRALRRDSDTHNKTLRAHETENQRAQQPKSPPP